MAGYSKWYNVQNSSHRSRYRTRQFFSFSRVKMNEAFVSRDKMLLIMLSHASKSDAQTEPTLKFRAAVNRFSVTVWYQSCCFNAFLRQR